jgi:hypothetical protein
VLSAKSKSSVVEEAPASEAVPTGGIISTTFTGLPAIAESTDIVNARKEIKEISLNVRRHAKEQRRLEGEARKKQAAIDERME